MGVLDKIINVLDTYEDMQDKIWERSEQERENYIKKHGHPPLNGYWCSTIEVNKRIYRRFRKRMKEALKEGENG